MGKPTLYLESSTQSRGMSILWENDGLRNGIDVFFLFFLGKIPVYHIREWAMQTIIFVLGAEILINLHQTLNLFFGVHDP